MSAENILESLGVPVLPPVSGSHPGQTADMAEVSDVHPDAGGSESAASDIPVGELIATVAMLGFGFMAKRRGEHWNLSPAEAEQLGNATAAVLDKYVPNVQAGPEVALLIVGVTVLAPRLMMDAGRPEKDTEAEKTDDAAA